MRRSDCHQRRQVMTPTRKAAMPRHAIDATPLPSRRARRDAERAGQAQAMARRSTRASRGSSIVPATRAPLGRLGIRGRAAAAAVAAGMALGVPVAAFSASTVLPAYGATPAVTESVVDRVHDSAQQRQTEGGGAADLLTVDDVDIARAEIMAATANSATVTCAPADAANGVTAGMTDLPDGPAVVSPMVEGSFRMSSAFGDRTHPIFGAASTHNGMDFAADLGTPIHSVAAGTVIHSGANIGAPGTLVVIEHEIDGEVWTSWYLHMYPEDIAVTEGQQVTAGDRVGAVGSAGNSTGPHLHLEIHQGPGTGGPAVDPSAWLADQGATNSPDAIC